MSERGPDGNGRPLTRRELRARGAAGQSPADSDARWSDDVRWSLHGELPDALPPEPEVDDVHWDAPGLQPPDSAPADGDLSADWPLTELDDTTAAGVEDTVPVAGVPRRQSAWPGLHSAPEVEAPVEDGPPAESASLEVASEATGGFPVPAPHAGPAVEAMPAPGPETGWMPEEPGPPTAQEPQPAEPEELPTLYDLLAARPAPPAGPAEHGWQGALRRATGGLLALRPGPAEQRQRASIALGAAQPRRAAHGRGHQPQGRGAQDHRHPAARRDLRAAPRRLHPRLGQQRDARHARLAGPPGAAPQHRRQPAAGPRPVRGPGPARVGDLDNYVRSQGSAQFDVLASDEDAASAASIDAFRVPRAAPHAGAVLPGHGHRHRQQHAGLELAGGRRRGRPGGHRLDGPRGHRAVGGVGDRRAARDRSRGHRAPGRHGPVGPGAPPDPALAARLHDHFGQLTRDVLDVPYDASLVGGTPFEFDRLSRRTREAWLHVAAAVAEGL